MVLGLIGPADRPGLMGPRHEESGLTHTCSYDLILCLERSEKNGLLTLPKWAKVIKQGASVLCVCVHVSCEHGYITRDPMHVSSLLLPILLFFLRHDLPLNLELTDLSWQADQ